MNKNSLLLASLLLLFNCALYGSTKDIEFYLYDSESVQILESRMAYQILPYKNISLDVLGQSSWESRLNFNRDVRRSNLGTKIAFMQHKLYHNLLLDYDSYREESDLAPDAHLNKNGNVGYQLYFSPLDSLYLSVETKGLIRKEQDRYLKDNYLKSDGFLLSSAAGYRYETNVFTGFVRGNLSKKKMNWEEYHDLQGQLGFSFYPQRLAWDTNLQYFAKEDHIYALQENGEANRGSYQWQDRQNRQNINLQSHLLYYPADNLIFTIREYFSMRNTAFTQNLNRNNDESLNELSFEMDYLILDELGLIMKMGHSLSSKEYLYVPNTRNSENRALNSRVNWGYSEGDTLSVAAGIQLNRTMYPENENRWDNDMRTRDIRLSWLHYYRNYIRLNNLFVYLKREDIYLDKMLSVNNHDLDSYSYLPDAEILLGDRIAFKQSYSIRADYTRFHFAKERSDKLYRQLGYRYSLIFDSFPYLARIKDGRWDNTVFRPNKGSAFMLQLDYGYEENQYGTAEEDYYILDSKNRKHSAAITLKHDIGNLYYSFSPQISWGTWKEYSLITGLYWSFDNGSYFDFSLSPFSEDLSKIDWRTSINLSLHF